jgi:hypothetical protein
MNKRSGGVDIESERVDVEGDVIGRDRIENTSIVNEGGPLARYAVIGLVVVAVFAILVTAIRAPTSQAPDNAPSPVFSPSTLSNTTKLTTPEAAVPTTTPYRNAALVPTLASISIPSAESITATLYITSAVGSYSCWIDNQGDHGKLIDLSNGTAPRGLENYYAQSVWDVRFPVEVADGVFLFVPIRTFQRAEKRGDKHLVTLTNDQTILGSLKFAVFCHNLRGAKDSELVKYDLGEADQIVIIGQPGNESDSTASDQGELWTLKMSFPLSETYTAFEPAFGCSLYGCSLAECHDFLKQKKTFVISDTLCNLGDFSNIEMIHDNQQITVQQRDKQPATGPFSVKDCSGRLLLVMNLLNRPEMLVVDIGKTDFVLHKRSP